MKDTDQCRRRVCKKAESPSMRTRMDTEMAAQPANTMYRKMPPWKSVDIRPGETNIHMLAPNLTKITRWIENLFLRSVKNSAIGYKWVLFEIIVYSSIYFNFILCFSNYCLGLACCHVLGILRYWNDYLLFYRFNNQVRWIACRLVLLNKKQKLHFHATPTTHNTTTNHPVNMWTKQNIEEYSLPFRSNMFHATSASCACASDSAHRRRYDAVWDTLPSTYSIVWIPCRR